MSQSVVARWLVVSRDLQQVVAKPSPDSEASYRAFSQAVDAIGTKLKQLGSDKPNLSDCQKLVIQEKVPLLLAKTCAQSIDISTTAFTTWRAVAALTTLLKQCPKDTAEQAKQTTPPPTSLGNAVREQLQQSGVLLRLPQLLTAAAQLVATSTGPEASSSSPCWPAAMPDVTLKPVAVWSYLCDVVAFFSAVSCTWREGLAWLEVVVPLATAAVRLIMANIRAVDQPARQQQQQQLDQATAYGVFRLLMLTHMAALDLVNGILGVHGCCNVLQVVPATRQLLLCPEYMQCLQLYVLINDVGLMPAVRKQLAGVACRASATGSVNPAARQPGSGAPAQLRLQVADGARSKLAVSHKQGAVQLGLDVRSVMWCAAAVIDGFATDIMSLFLGAVADAHNFWLRHATPQELGQRAHQLQQQQQPWWLPARSLRFAAKLQAAGGAQFPLLCDSAIKAASSTFRDWQAAAQPQRHSLPVLQRLSEAWAAALLPWLTQLLQKLAQEAERQQLQGGVAPSICLRGGTNPPGELGEEVTSQPRLVLLINMRALVMLCSLLVQPELLCAAVEADPASRPEDLDGDGQLLLLPAVQQQSKDICASLEAYVRCFATTAPVWSTDGPSSSSQARPPSWATQDGIMTAATFTSNPGCPLLVAAAAAGPGSSEQRQFCSLLASLLKFSGNSKEQLLRIQPRLSPEAAAAAPHTTHSVSEYCCWAAARAVSWLLSKQTSGTAAAAAPSAAAAATKPADCTSGLAALAIFGRCCLSWSEKLEQQGPCLQRQFKAAQQSNLVYEDSRRLAELLFGFTATHACFRGLTSKPVLTSCAESCLQWLQDRHTSAKLSAVGYDTQHLAEQLQGLVSAQEAAEVSTGTDAAPFTALAQQLRAVGSALNTLAVPVFCNSPSCLNMSGPSELQLVSGRSCVCAACRTARYCSKACQKRHWGQHKPVCQALAAATAAAEAAAVTPPVATPAT